MRIIKQPHRYTFIPIPKTGSTSIKSALGGCQTLDHEDNHASLKMFIQKYGHSVWDSKVFTVVRNPYDRLVSSYFHLKRRTVRHPVHDPDIIGNVESAFERFVLYQLEECMENGNDIMILMRQCNWIRFKDKVVSKIFKFENGFDLVGRYLNVGSIPTLNQTSHNRWGSYYTHKTKDIVYRIYEKDFDFLKYSKKIC